MSGILDTGFRIFYEVTSGNSTRVGKSFILSDQPYQEISYPEIGTYTNDELSTFVYAPGFTCYPGVNIRASFSVKEIEPYYDAVYAYRFVTRGASTYPYWAVEAK